MRITDYMLSRKAGRYLRVADGGWTFAWNARLEKTQKHNNCFTHPLTCCYRYHVLSSYQLSLNEKRLYVFGKVVKMKSASLHFFFELTLFFLWVTSLSSIKSVLLTHQVRSSPAHHLNRIGLEIVFSFHINEKCLHFRSPININEILTYWMDNDLNHSIKIVSSQFCMKFESQQSMANIVVSSFLVMKIRRKTSVLASRKSSSRITNFN